MNPTTRPGALVLLLVSGAIVTSAGCSNPARDRMIGKWEATLEMSEEDIAKVMPAENSLVAGFGKLLLKRMRAEMVWEFAADNTVTGSATLMGKEATRTGVWRFVSGDDTTTTVQIQFDQEEPRELKFTFTDPDTLQAQPFTSGKWQWSQIIKFKRVVATR